MAFLCPSRLGNTNRAKRNRGKEPIRGRITGSDSVDTIEQVGLDRSDHMYTRSKVDIIQDFSPKAPGEVQVKKGETGRLIHTAKDWLYIEKTNGQTGYVPVSVCRTVKDIDYNTDISCTNSVRSSRLSEYSADLSEENTDIESVVSRNMSPLFQPKPQEYSSSGILDKTDVKPFYKTSHGQYIVLFDFLGINENDVSVERAELVDVLNIEDPDWSWVRKYDGLEGFVPKTYICPVEPLRKLVRSGGLNKKSGSNTVTNQGSTYIQRSGQARSQNQGSIQNTSTDSFMSSTVSVQSEIDILSKHDSAKYGHQNVKKKLFDKTDTPISYTPNSQTALTSPNISLQPKQPDKDPPPYSSLHMKTHKESLIDSTFLEDNHQHDFSDQSLTDVTEIASSEIHSSSQYPRQPLATILSDNSRASPYFDRRTADSLEYSNTYAKNDIGGANSPMQSQKNETSKESYQNPSSANDSNQLLNDVLETKNSQYTEVSLPNIVEKVSVKLKPDGDVSDSFKNVTEELAMILKRRQQITDGSISDSSRGTKSSRVSARSSVKTESIKTTRYNSNVNIGGQQSSYMVEYVMKYEYKGQRHGQQNIYVQKGEAIYADLNSQNSSEWIWVHIPRTNQYGYIPASYAEKQTTVVL
ncbi:SH3 domain-containing protein Dlish-like isoform X1 [Mytilus californianus]|uniref:SH3 domain-containing protein Dlish-like isoform X1 n=2 Tax=Mytilus californianus TaxID=6549 RepID=UPI002245711F|nr:SH3 domain-containing protein Dlish-like isoform X1 [Mytilus californianus]